jgi:hypothetical protein
MRFTFRSHSDRTVLNVFLTFALLLLSSASTGTSWASPSTTAFNPRAPLSDLNASLPVPSELVVRQDDRVATLQWDAKAGVMLSALPQGVKGYRVTWGPVSDPTANVRIVQQRIVQLQPLAENVTYVAQVQAVDSYGQLSAPSAQVPFASDATRVNQLRTQMNGFFDDFNLAEGAVDERKWNTAYSRCNAAWANSYFINKQFHAHNTISSGDCDRAQQINRARVPLDLSDNGTRTIVFDFDGTFRRNHWYIDLVPSMVDITGPERYEPGTLRFTQTEQSVSISIFNDSGAEVKLPLIPQTSSLSMDLAGVQAVPNVRRNWQIRVRKDYAEVTIDGKLIAATLPGSFQLKHDSFHVLWGTFSYNSPKANQPYVLVHWDNFGFDAPAGKPWGLTTHNYKLTNSGSDFIYVQRWDGTSPKTVKLNVPDPVAGAVARRLMITLQMQPFNSYEWKEDDKVIVNGQAIPLPRPVSKLVPPHEPVVGVIEPYSMVIPLPEGVIRQGENTLIFDVYRVGFHNIHVELDFPASAAPTYTPPASVAAEKPLVALPAVGPNLLITHIGQQIVDRYSTVTDKNTLNPTVSGTIPVKVEVNNDIALEATGSNLGVAVVELIVDGRVIMRQRTDKDSPAPGVSHTFNLDTRQLPNGTHLLFVRAFDARCTPSVPEYGGAFGQSGAYLPLHITVANPGSAQVATQTLAASATYKIHFPIVSAASAFIGGSCFGQNLLSVPADETAAQGQEGAIPAGEQLVAEAAMMQRRSQLLNTAPFGRYFLCE